MDKFAEECLQEVALEGLDGITLETFWMRLATRDPPFSLALDEYSKPVIWHHIATCDQVDFFELPEAREMPVLRDTLLDGPRTWNGGSHTMANAKKMSETVYPLVFVDDKEKGIKGSCATYYERQDVTKEIRDDGGNVKIPYAEAVTRWGAKLVMVASQDVRWECMMGLHGDSQVEMSDKQYIMLEAICRARHLGEWQFLLCKWMKLEPRNIFYHRVSLSKGGFIKKRHAVYQVEDRPHTRSVILFGTSFKEHVTQPMYEALMEGMSDLLEKRPNRLWTVPALRTTLREQFCDIVISDKMFKRILSAARAAKLIESFKMTHEEVFNEKKLTKHHDQDLMVNGVKLLRTYEEYINEENLEEEDEEEKKDPSVMGDPSENLTVAERNMKANVVNVIEEKQRRGEYMPLRVIKHNMMIDHYITRFILKRLTDEKIVTKIMTDEGRQRTAVYAIANSADRAQHLLAKKGGAHKGSPENVPSTSTSATGGDTRETVVKIKEESQGRPSTATCTMASIDLDVKRSSEQTSNHWRRRQFILDFMRANKVVEYVFPVVKAVRTEEKRMGSKITCDAKTVKRLIGNLCKENLLQQIETVVVSDDGLHSKTITLILEAGMKPDDLAVTLVLQSAKFRFFGSLSSAKRKKVHKVSPKTPTVTAENADNSKAAASEKSPKEIKTPKKKKKPDKEKKHGSKSHKKSKHKHKDKDGEEAVSSDEDVPKVVQYQSRKYYFRQLGYQPKMLRMKVAHVFMWHMVYGTFNTPLKKETLKDIEDVNIYDEPEQLDDENKPSEAGETETVSQDGEDSQMEVVVEASLDPIPIKIAKAGDSLPEIIDDIEEIKPGAIYTISPSEERPDQVHQSNGGTPLLADKPEDSSVLYTDATESSQKIPGIQDMEFTVYSNTYDWRRYVPPMPNDPTRPPGWCVLRDLLLAMPISIFLKIVSLPVEVKGIQEYLKHPLKKHILMRHLPIDIRKQLLRGRSYLFSLQDVFIKLASMGLVVLANLNNFNKDQLAAFVCKKASILDTTTSAPAHKKISDQQRYMRRFYQLNSSKKLEDYWFDLQCICLDTPLGMGKERGKTRKIKEDSHYDAHIKSIAVTVSDMSQPIDDHGIPPGDGRGAGGLDGKIFSHLRRNWNWYNAVPEVHYNRYTAMNPNDGGEREQEKTGKRKLKRLGSIQYRRSNMSKGTTVEVVSVSRQERKELQTTVTNLKAKKFEGQEKKSSPSKKQIAKDKTKEAKDLFEEAKKKDAQIEDNRRQIRKPVTDDGKRNTITYDDKDEEARSQMSKMRVDWSPEEDSLILLCRVASTILNTKARKMGTFVPWYVIRDILQKNIERSKDKTTKSVAKRSHHIMKNPSTNLNFKICLAEAQADKDLMDLVQSQTAKDYSKITVCADEFSQFVIKLQEKFQNNNSTIGGLRDIGELNKYTITPVHHYAIVDENTFTNRDIKNVEDIHFKLLCSLVLSSLSSCKNSLFNNHLLYRTYEQYDQDLLGSVFMYIRKLGFCNRYRKSAHLTNQKRVIPVAPISIQLSSSYKERFNTAIPDIVFRELCEFLAKLESAEDSFALATEVDGGDCAGALSFIFSKKVTFDITLPDQIIVVDTNLLEGDLAEKDIEDSDSDGEAADGESTTTPNKTAKEDQSDIDRQMKIQKERTSAITETMKQQDKTVQESTDKAPVTKAPVTESVTPSLVFSDHSYSVCQRTSSSQDDNEGASQMQGGDDSITTSQTQSTTDGDDGTNKEGVKTDTSQCNSAGYYVKGSQVSHSRWLILQGHAAAGVCGLGKNIQDNTSINACTITLYKSGEDQKLVTRTEASSLQPQPTALLWDFVRQNDGKFTGFHMSCDVRTSLSAGTRATYILDPKWTDVDSMIRGIGLEWSPEDLHVLRTVYTCIEDANSMGIAAEANFQHKCASLLPNTTAKTVRDCLHILVQEQLVLELGFDILRFAAVKHASPWLIHSTRLDRSLTTDAQQNKKQRLDPPLTDNPPVIDITEEKTPLLDITEEKTSVIDIAEEKTEECVIINDDDNNSRMESNKNVGSCTRKENVSSNQAAVSQADDEEVEVEDEPVVSKKRKRPLSPTECKGTPVTFFGRPWLSIEGYQSDSELQKYLQLVLLTIATKPGIKEESLFESVRAILHPVECLEVLKVLKDIGCITRHRIHKLKPTSVFKTPMQGDANEKIYFYQPTANCLPIYAELTKTMQDT